MPLHPSAPGRRSLPLAWLALVLAPLLFATMATTPGRVAGVEATVLTTACDAVNLRSSASTAGTIRARLNAGASVSVTATVTGSTWSVNCPRSSTASTWYRISAVNGRSVSSLYGTAYVYGATALFTSPEPAPSTAAPATTVPGPAADPVGDEVMRLLNLDRRALGKPALVLDADLARVARDAPFACPTDPSLRPTGRAADMATRGYFSHSVKGCAKSDGTLYGAVEIARSVFGFTLARSEIIAWNSYPLASAVYQVGCDVGGRSCTGGSTPTSNRAAIAQRSFMSSATHRAVELGTSRRVGCGSARVAGSNKTYVVCLFSDSGSTTIASPTTTPAPEPTPTPEPEAPSPTPTPSSGVPGTPMQPACDRVNVRSSASTGSAIRVTLRAGTAVTVDGTVRGGGWSTWCSRSVAGSDWYRVTAIAGRTVRSAYGVTYLYAATGVLKAAPAIVSTTDSPPVVTPSPTPVATPAPTPTPTPTPAPTPTPTTSAMVAACDAVNVRTAASTTAAVKARLRIGTPVTVSGSVNGSGWSVTCPRSVVSRTWYRITAVNGRSTSSLYGVGAVYAASALFVPDPRSSAQTPAPATSPSPAPSPSPSPSPTPPPAPSPTPAPSATPTPAPSASSPPAPAPASTPAASAMATACDFVNLRASASTGAAIRAQVRTGTAVTVVATVTGTRWTVACPRSAAASTWYRISAIGGRSVSSLYGVSYLYGATALFAPAPGGSTATPTPAGITPLGATVTFFGRGYGHGVGLSQYGARGRALDGQDAATILAHYFQGTTIGTVPLDTQIRVLVLESAVPTAASPLIVVGRGGGWTLDGIDATFPADARLRLLPVAEGEGGTWRALVDAADGSILSDTIIGKSIRVRPASDETTLQLWSKPSAYDLFRGVLRIVGTTTVDVVNELPLETYLRGVVPAEMPSSWPVESIRAQAIAARSYAAFRLRPGSGTFDVYDDTRSQVYQGVRREQPTTDAALEASAGQVLRSGSAIVNAFFHSTGGGATEDNENAFVSSSGARVAGPVSYLRGSADRRPDGTAFDDGAPYATWRSASYSIDALSAIFAADPRTDVGTLLGLDLRDRGVSGRLVSITLVGTTGSRTVSGDVFRAVFSAHRPAADPVLRSNLLDLSPIP